MSNETFSDESDFVLVAEYRSRNGRDIVFDDVMNRLFEACPQAEVLSELILQRDVAHFFAESLRALAAREWRKLMKLEGCLHIAVNDMKRRGPLVRLRLNCPEDWSAEDLEAIVGRDKVTFRTARTRDGITRLPHALETVCTSLDLVRG